MKTERLTRVLTATGAEKVEALLEHSNIIDKFSIDLYHLKAEEIKAFCEKHGFSWGVGQHGLWAWIEFRRKDGRLVSNEDLDALGIRPPRRPRREERETEVVPGVPFGWLPPAGKFIEADFGDHERAAREIADYEKWLDEYDKWRHAPGGGLRLVRDYLVEVRGYVLIHNPALGGLGAPIVTKSKPLTKRQREFLFDAYTAAGDTAAACGIIEEAAE